LASITYPSGRVVNQTYDPIGRLQTIADAANNYITITPTSDYNAAGQLQHFTYGNGVNANFGYNDHLQITSISYTKSGQPDLLDLTYSYGANGGTAPNNGQIASIADTTVANDHSRDMTYTYDAWGRLSIAQAGPNGTETWKYSYNYDRFGNRRNQNFIAGSSGYQVLLTIDPLTNRISDPGNSYDANGNMLNDTVHGYSFDAENELKSVDSSVAAYTYDDGGLRVKSVVSGIPRVYIYSGTTLLAEYVNGNATPSVEYIYSGSGLIAKVASTVVTYVHPDHLSTRTETDSAASVARTYGHHPFGETWYETGTPSKWKFTSYENDTESGLNYALARFHSPTFGRFLSPDPIGGSIGSPQSLNGYPYVQNDPINATDPLGLLMDPACAQVGGCGGGGSDFSSDVWNDFLRESQNNWLSEGGQLGDLEPRYQRGPGARLTATTIQIGCVSHDVGGVSSEPTCTVYWDEVSQPSLIQNPQVHGMAYYFFHHFSLSGRNGKPLCAVAAFSNTVDEFNPFTQEGAGEEAAKIAAEAAGQAGESYYTAAAWGYATGRGLVVPLRSSIFRGIISNAKLAGRAGWITTLAIADAHLYRIVRQTDRDAVAGNCAGITE
jgi:RHS repeat-associated protein